MEIPITLDEPTRQSLQGQLFDKLRDLILNGRLKAGTPLPPSRAFSEQLNISRNTVMLAYDRLIAEGYVQTRETVGTFVSFDLPEDCLLTRRAMAVPTDMVEYPDRSTAIPFEGRAHAVINQHKAAIDFWVGRPDPHTFPVKTWRRLVGRALVSSATHITEYRDAGGAPELRRAIADHLGPARGITVSPEQVIIVSGSQGALNLTARLLLREKMRVATENPCYQGAAFLYESYRARLVPVPVDENGIDTDRMPSKGVQLAYVTPSHQYPMGFTLSLERRLRLLDWARRCGAYIVEDDYDSDFRYRGSPLTALMGLDRHGCVIYLGTFSKSIGAGLRLGYMVVPKILVQSARTAKALLDNGHPWLDQAVMAEFIGSGGYANHLRRIRQMYLARRDCLLDSLQRSFGKVVVTGQDGGMHLVWHLPKDFPAAHQLQRLALRKSVGIYSLKAGSAYDYGSSKYSDRAVMLGFSSLNEKQIRIGVERIAEVVDHAHA